MEDMKILTCPDINYGLQILSSYIKGNVDINWQNEIKIGILWYLKGSPKSHDWYDNKMPAVYLQNQISGKNWKAFVDNFPPY